MSNTTKRVCRVSGVLIQETPYKVNVRQIREVCAILPKPRSKLLKQQVRLIAAIVALPYVITP